MVRIGLLEAIFIGELPVSAPDAKPTGLLQGFDGPGDVTPADASLVANGFYARPRPQVFLIDVLQDADCDVFLGGAMARIGQ